MEKLSYLRIFIKNMVNTFLPLVVRKDDGTLDVKNTLIFSLYCLDKTRLNKQRLEAQQIYTALVTGQGWANHPATLMWRGYLELLSHYHNICLYLWLLLGGNSSATLLFTKYEINDLPPEEIPWWFGWSALAESHVSSLLRKHPFYYGSFLTCPAYAQERGYIWPSHLEEKYGVEVCLTFLSKSAENFPEWYAAINYDTAKNAGKSFQNSFTLSELKNICHTYNITVPKNSKKENLLMLFDSSFLQNMIRYRKWGC